jgi:hypothetical protein
MMSAAEHFLAALVSALKGSDSSGPYLVTPEVDQDSLNLFAEGLSDYVDGATEVFTKLQANCVLARRDSMLRASALSSDEQSTLRALPLEDGSLFGPLVPEFMKGKAESSRDDAFLKVADSPMAPPAATKRPPAKPAQDAPAAKKPKQVLKQKRDKKKKHVNSSSGPSGKPKALPPQ